LPDGNGANTVVFAELLKNPRALVLSLLFHLAMIGLVVFKLNFSERPDKIKFGAEVSTIQAEVIDLKILEARDQQKKDETKRKAEKKRRQEEARRLAEKKKLKAAKKRKQEEKRVAAEKAKAEEKRKADAKRAADSKRKAEEKARIEAARVAEVKRKAEEARIAEEKRKVEEARIAEEKRKAEKRRLAAEEQQRKEDILRSQMLAEENQRRLNNLREAYIVAIQQKVHRNWIRPAINETLTGCEVRVIQAPDGTVLNVEFGSCSGSTTIYRTSIENALYKASPLPSPGDPGLFARELRFIFNPDGQ
jgi:colicin import membrane protein